MKINLLIVITIVFSMSLLAKNLEEQTIKPATKSHILLTKSLKVLVEKVNANLAKETSLMRLFAQVADKKESAKKGYLIPIDTVVYVKDINSWPDLTVTSYIVLLRKDGSVSAVQEVPTSESGDWSNSYTHYYDESGKTIAFERYSGFFNGCPHSPAKERSHYYLDKKEIIAKDYSLVGNNNKVLKASDCEGFPYRHEYTIYHTLKETLNKYNIKLNLRNTRY